MRAKASLGSCQSRLLILSERNENLRHERLEIQISFTIRVQP